MSVRVAEASNWENRLATLSSSFQHPYRKALTQLNDSTTNQYHSHQHSQYHQQHQKEQEHSRQQTYSDDYYYAPASPTLTGSATMAQHYQPRQPPTLNIAAAAAATSSSSSTSNPLSDQHPHHQHHHQQQPSPSSYHASHHHHQSMQAQHVPPYSAPAMSVGGGGGSYYASSASGLTTPGTGHSSVQASTGYNSSMAMHQSAMQHNGNGVSNGGNASGASLPFMLSSAGAPSQQAQHQSFSPVSSASYNGGAGAGSGYAGANHFHQQQFSAPHSMHSFPHRITNSSSSFDGITGGAGGSSYDFHQHVGHGVGLVDSGHGLLSAHGFDANGLLPLKSKRKQVKNACVNCQKACKRCDEGRPCSRCVKYGLTATCMDSARKERKRGIKRGPYKRRATTGSQPNGYASAGSSSSATLTGLNGSSFGQSHGGAMSGHHSHHQMHHQQPQQQQHSYYHQQSHHSMLGHGQSSITSPVSPSEGHGKTDMDASSSVAGEISPVMYLGSSFDHTASSGHHSMGDNTHHFASSRPNAGSTATLNAAPMSYEGSAPSGSSPVPYGRELYAQGTSVASTNVAPSSSSLNTAGTLMQPPPNRPSSHASMRTDYERPLAAFSSAPYGSSLYSNAPLAGSVANTEARLRSTGPTNGVVSTSGNFSQHQPASAPPSSANFSLTSSGNSKPSPSSSFQQRNVTVPSLFSPSSMHPSSNASNGGNSASSATPSSGFLSASSGSLVDGHNGLGQQHRLYSEGTLATLSNGSGTSGSSIHSPRTPVGLGTVHSSSTHGELGLLHGASNLSSSTSSPGHEGKLMMGAGVDGNGTHGGAGGNNGGSAGQASSYIHHPNSSTLSSLNPVTAGAFLNPPSNNAGQGFTLHIPHSARHRGGSGNGAGSTSTDASAARPRSAYDHEDGLPSSYNSGMGTSNDAMMHKAAAATSASEGEYLAHKSIDSQPSVGLPSPASSRYQLPSPRQDPIDGRIRSGLAKLEPSGTVGDVASAAYGTA